MAMGKRKDKQPELWVAAKCLADPPRHRFYEKLNELLAEIDFDQQAERICESCYEGEERRGRPSVIPGVYFRMHMIGYLEGIESERGLEWRCQDSLSLRQFLGLNLTDSVPDHSSLCRNRQRYSLEIHKTVFGLMLELVERKGLLRGRVMGVDSTYIRADASMKSIVRRDTRESYQDYILHLAREDGIENPTMEDGRRLDRKRPGKKTRNEEWESSTDPDSRVMRMKDGATHLAYKTEHVVDMETGAIVSALVYPADLGDMKSLHSSVRTARATMDSLGVSPAQPLELVADKGYHRSELLLQLKQDQIRTFIPEKKQRGKRHWADKGGRATAVAYYQNQARISRSKGKSYLRKRGVLLERPFAHICETGGARRTRLRGRENVAKRYMIQAGTANLGLVLRSLFGLGTPRGWAAQGIRGVITAVYCSIFLFSGIHKASRSLLNRISAISRKPTRKTHSNATVRSNQLMIVPHHDGWTKNGIISTGC